MEPTPYTTPEPSKLTQRDPSIGGQALKSDTERSSSATISMPTWQLSALDRVANDYGMARSHLIRDVLVDWLKAQGITAATEGRAAR